MAVTTLQRYYMGCNGNFFDASITGVDLSTGANGNISEATQRLISNLCVPIYPVVIHEGTFTQRMIDGVQNKLSELRRLDAAYDDETTGTVKRTYGSRQVSDVKGARQHTSQHGEQLTTDARGATRAVDAKGQVSVTDTLGARQKTDAFGRRQETTDFGRRVVDVDTDAETDHSETLKTFDQQPYGSTADVVEPSTGETTTRGAKHTKTDEAAREDVKDADAYTDTHSDEAATDTHVTAAVTDTHSTDAVTDTQTRGQYTDTDSDAAYTDTHTEGEHTDTEHKELTLWEIAELHAQIEAQVTSILRQIVVEAAVCARGVLRNGAV